MPVLVDDNTTDRQEQSKVKTAHSDETDDCDGDHHHHVKWNDNDNNNGDYVAVAVANTNDDKQDHTSSSGNDENQNHRHGLLHNEDAKKTMLGTEDDNDSHHRPSSPLSSKGGSSGGNSSGGNSGGGGNSSGGHCVGPFCSCLTGMRKDLKARVPLYLDDWKVPNKSSFFKVFNATIFAFVVQLIPSLIFAELLDKNTHGSLSVAETLMSTGIIGIMYALLSGQPLVLVGITGPVAILLGTSYRLADQFNSDYWPFFWWLCIWTSILHLITAMVGLVNLVWTITPFTTQIFEFFIASTFIFESIRDLLQPLQLRYSTDALIIADATATVATTSTTAPRALLSEATTTSSSPELERSAAYAGLVIGIGTFYLCWVLHFAETWRSFTGPVRTFLASYNMMIALVVMTGLSYIPGVDQGSTEEVVGEDGSVETVGGLVRVHVEVPWDWQPTADRSWIINPLNGISIEGIFGALFPAFMLYLLFFIDHNISSILTQSPKYNLTKPPAYHWDFFVLGLTIIPCGILGLPPGSGVIPEAPLHTRALCTRKYEFLNGQQHEVYFDCEEQRWSALFQAALMFVALACMRVISWIPTGCLFGIFLYLGVGTMHGNEIWERITLLVVPSELRPRIPVVERVSKWSTVVLYTSIQVFLAAVTFAIAQFVSWGYVFPAFIAGFVPFRSFIVNRLFDENDLKYLDPVDETDDDYIAEQIDYEEDLSPKRTSEFGFGLSEFRIGNVPHDPDEYYQRHPEYQISERSFDSNTDGENNLRNRSVSSCQF